MHGSLQAFFMLWRVAACQQCIDVAGGKVLQIGLARVKYAVKQGGNGDIAYLVSVVCRRGSMGNGAYRQQKNGNGRAHSQKLRGVGKAQDRR